MRLVVHSFGAFIREQRDAILDTWKARARVDVDQAKRVSDAQLVDHVPHLLDRVAELSDAFDASRGEQGLPEPREHARQRVFEGFDLDEVVAEYGILREVILELWEHDTQKTSTRPLNRALDQSIGESVHRYVLLRNRVIRALDSVSAAAFASADLDDLLTRLLRVFLDEMPAVQTCAILLREGDRLRVRASVGLEEELAGAGFSLAIGEGFSGTVAKEKEPLLLHAASSEPLVKSPVLRAKGVRALYGVPICAEGREVLGIAHMGSLTAEDFSQEDKDLFASMVARAALAIDYQVAKKAAAEAAAVRDEILAVVSHDLRTPIGSVMMAADLLERTVAPPEQARKPLATIRRSASAMHRLVDDLVDFGSIEARRLRLHVEPAAPAELLAEAAEGHVGLIAQHGLRLARARK